MTGARTRSRHPTVTAEIEADDDPLWTQWMREIDAKGAG